MSVKHALSGNWETGKLGNLVVQGRNSDVSI